MPPAMPAARTDRLTRSLQSYQDVMNNMVLAIALLGVGFAATAGLGAGIPRARPFFTTAALGCAVLLLFCATRFVSLRSRRNRLKRRKAEAEERGLVYRDCPDLFTRTVNAAGEVVCYNGIRTGDHAYRASDDAGTVDQDGGTERTDLKAICDSKACCDSGDCGAGACPEWVSAMGDTSFAVCDTPKAEVLEQWPDPSLDGINLSKLSDRVPDDTKPKADVHLQERVLQTPHYAWTSLTNDFDDWRTHS